MAYFKKNNNAKGQGGRGPNRDSFDRKGQDGRSTDGKSFERKGPGGKGPGQNKSSYGNKPGFGQKSGFDKKWEGKKGTGQGSGFDRKDFGDKGYGQKRDDFESKQSGFEPKRFGNKPGFDQRKPGNKGYGQKGPGGKGPERKGTGPKWPSAEQEELKRKEIIPAAPAVENEEFEDANDRIEGRNPVMEAIKSGRTIDKLLVSKGEKEGSIRQIIYMAKEKGIVVQEVERTRLDTISTTRSHQGIIAFAAMKEYIEVEDMLQLAADKNETPFIIILDEITDPHNLGSILRTADAVGAHGVIIPKRRAVGLSAIVAKSSAGAMEYVPVARVSNIPQTIEKLKKNNVWIMGTDMDGEKAFYDHDLKGAVAVVIGSEGEGMGKLVKESCDFIVKIPMVGKIASLNASVAGAVVMYEVFRQRKGL